MKERISAITEKWFLSEEALFMTFCTRTLMFSLEYTAIFFHKSSFKYFLS